MNAWLNTVQFPCPICSLCKCGPAYFVITCVKCDAVRPISPRRWPRGCDVRRRFVCHFVPSRTVKASFFPFPLPFLIFRIQTLLGYFARIASLLALYRSRVLSTQRFITDEWDRGQKWRTNKSEFPRIEDYTKGRGRPGRRGYADEINFASRDEWRARARRRKPV